MTDVTNLHEKPLRSNFTEPYLELDPEKVLFEVYEDRTIYEEWVDIPDYEGYYQMSNFSRVKSLPRYKSPTLTILKQSKPIKYLMVRLIKNYVKGGCQTHQLMAICFLGHVPCGHKTIVDHKDNDNLNNRLSNLQLITHRLNASKDKKGGTSRYTGVCWNKKKKKWIAQIFFNGKSTHLGYFKNEKTAGEYYKKALLAIEKGEEFDIKRRVPASSFKGVYKGYNGKWSAAISIDKKQNYLGTFETEAEAIEAVKQARAKINQ